MKFDNSKIDTAKLLEFINDRFQIDLVSEIQFIPKGEEGYCYYIKDINESGYFVKALKTQSHLEEALSIIQQLHDDYEKKYVLAPIQTNKGNVSANFGQYQISLFPFIQGASIYETMLTLEDSKRIATMMADFHSINYKKFEHLRRETFDNPFENNILNLIHSAENGNQSRTNYQQQASELLIKEKDDVQATLIKMKTMQKKLQAASLDWTITHGDPNYANIMRDLQGDLYLIDFGEIAIGPIERDLMAFSENEFFGKFISTYKEIRPEAKFHLETFEFYIYRWCLQEISDYGMQIFFGTSGEIEHEHAWAELQPYLPIPHLDIQKSLQRIEKILWR
ncbi:phosphotransferase [Lederbergia citrea]|uniref:Phosphotransferase n=1 Tax=Lederbergia citrea TaxID=2833581 RepID=A0A942Z438_9BACI|nr:phosphotransferase [Lederbergia citrea]MBS4176767.1 phosphotransferase [Lederbergia citrea]MBS4203328.1 phosphotransferase [Lederbergia citrea]MBS4222000.1 phosphotransferase [Lederbergia citrea]